MSRLTTGDIRGTLNVANCQIDNLVVSKVNGSNTENKTFISVGETPQNEDIIRYDSASMSWKPTSFGPPGSDFVTTQDKTRLADDLVPVFNGTTGQSVKTSKIQIISESTNFDYIRNIATPFLDNDAANKLYVDTIATSGIKFGKSVYLASTGNVVLSGLYAIDGVFIVAGQRILVKDQTDATENGVYVSAVGAWSRSSEEALGTPASGKTFAVDDGAINGGDVYSCNTDGSVFGDAITYVRVATFGDISGPTIVSDNAIVRWDGIDGKRVQNSTVQLSDNGGLTGLSSVSLNGSISGSVTVLPATSGSGYGLTLPGNQGGVGTYLKNDGTGTLSWSTPGDISGPVSSVDNTIARFDGTTGKVVQGSGVSVSDTADMVGMKSLGLKDTAGTGVLTIQTPGSITDYSVTLPGTQGGVGTYLKNDGTGTLAWSTPGDISGPVSSVDNTIPRFDGTTGKVVQGSVIVVSDTGEMSGTKSIGINGDTSGSLTLRASATTTSHSLTFPATQGGVETYLKNDGSGNLVWSKPGDVVGPASSVDNTIARFDGTTGKVVQGSGVSVSDTADVGGVNTLGLKGSTTGTLSVQAPSTVVDYSFTFPSSAGASGSYLKTAGLGVTMWDTPGDVKGPASSVDNTIARFDGATGKIVQGSGVSVSDTADVGGVKTLGLSGSTSGVLTVQTAATTTPHTLTFPGAQGAVGTYLKNDGTGTLSWSTSGDVVGPGSSVDNTLTRFDGTTGKNIQGSSLTISDVGDLVGMKTLGMKDTAGTGVLTIQTPSSITNYSVTLPGVQGAAGTYMKNNGSGVLTWDKPPGDVVGPVASLENSVARFDSTTGKMIDTSGVILNDLDEISGVKSVSLKGATSGELKMRSSGTTTPYTLTFPGAQGAVGTYLKNDGTGTLSWSTAGDMVGPVSSVDNTIARFDGTTGKVVQGSGVSVSDTADVGGVKTLGLSGSTSGALTVQTAATTTPHTLTFPGAQGGAGTYLKNDGSGTLSWNTVGDVVGPASSVDNAIARFDGATGKIVQGSGVSVSDTADVGGVKTLGLSGSTSGALTVQTAATTTPYTLTFPGAQGGVGTYLKNDGSGTLSWNTVGDVVGPVSSVDNRLVRFNGTTGKIVQECDVTVSDTADVGGVKTLGLSGSTSGALTVQTAATTTPHTLTFPGAQGGVGTYLKNDGTGTLSWNTAGDVVGPVSSTVNVLPRFSTTNGKEIKASTVSVSDGADVGGVKTLGLSGSTSGVLTVQTAATTTSHTLTFPGAQGGVGTYLKNNGSGTLSWSTSGDVVGPASSVDNTIARFDGTTGKVVQGSGVSVNDTADVGGVKTLGLSGSTSGVLTVQTAATTTPHTLTFPGVQGGNNTFLRNNGSGGLTWTTISGNVLNNFTAISDPTVTNDGTQGYSVGSQWLNTVKKRMYVALSVSTGAALWRRSSNLKDNLDATTDPTATDDSDLEYSVFSRWFNLTNNTSFVCVEDTPGLARWEIDSRKDNMFNALSVPGTSNDFNQGYARGSMWIYNKIGYMTTDVTNGSAKWDRISNYKTTITSVDPVVTDDSTQGYEVGSEWFNQSTGTSWLCVSSAQNVAQWNVTSQTTSTYMYWSGFANGDPSSGTNQFPATYTGNYTPTFNTSGKFLTLTTATNSLTGIANWNLTGFNFRRDFVMEVSIYQGSGADGIYYGFGGSSSWGGGDATANGSILYKYNTYTNNDSNFMVNGQNQPVSDDRTGVSYTNAWYQDRIEVRRCGAKRYATVFHGPQENVQNAYDLTNWTPGGTWFCVGARTGGSNATHEVGYVSVRYLD